MNKSTCFYNLIRLSWLCCCYFHRFRHLLAKHPLVAGPRHKLGSFQVEGQLQTARWCSMLTTLPDSQTPTAEKTLRQDRTALAALRAFATTSLEVFSVQTQGSLIGEPWQVDFLQPTVHFCQLQVSLAMPTQKPFKRIPSVLLTASALRLMLLQCMILCLWPRVYTKVRKHVCTHVCMSVCPRICGWSQHYFVSTPMCIHLQSQFLLVTCRNPKVAVPIADKQIPNGLSVIWCPKLDPSQTWTLLSSPSNQLRWQSPRLSLIPDSWPITLNAID